MADDDKKNGDNGFAKVDESAKAREAEVVAARERAEQARDAAVKRGEGPATAVKPAADPRGSGPRPEGVSSDLRSVPGERLPMDDRVDADSLHPTGDTMVHNAGNAGPWHPPERPQSVGVAGLPEGLMNPRPDGQPHPGREIGVPQSDPMLVAHSGTGTGMSAPQEAAVHHFRMRVGELRNSLRGFDEKLLGEGSPMHALAV